MPSLLRVSQLCDCDVALLRQAAKRACARSRSAKSWASFTFACCWRVRYCVPSPISHHGWLLLSKPATAPSTGVPALVPVAPASLVAKLSGWLSLSCCDTSSHHAKAPARSPSEALRCQPR